MSDLESENYNLYCTIEQCNGRIKELESENKRLRESLDAIYKVVNDSKENTRSFSIYDAARIYSECCYALGEDE